jgi:hypothetical protein
MATILPSCFSGSIPFITCSLTHLKKFPLHFLLIRTLIYLPLLIKPYQPALPSRFAILACGFIFALDTLIILQLLAVLP